MLGITKSTESLIIILISAIWLRAGAATNALEASSVTISATLIRDEPVCGRNLSPTVMPSSFHVRCDRFLFLGCDGEP